MLRDIIKIDEEKCNGCGLCVPGCPEGALQIIDGKVRLVSDLFCDGLGACIGECPEGAITVERREAEPYDERKVMANIVKQGTNTIKAHLKHLKDHDQTAFYNQATAYLNENGVAVPDLSEKMPSACGGGCPGSKLMEFAAKDSSQDSCEPTESPSHLTQWPVQIHLLPVQAPFFNNADILIAADCVPFAYADFHRDFLKGKKVLVGCPKLDDMNSYQQKLNEIIKINNIKSVTYVKMQVPCCGGFVPVLQNAISASGKDIPLEVVTISIDGKSM